MEVYSAWRSAELEAGPPPGCGGGVLLPRAGVQGVVVFYILDAVYESARTGAPVQIHGDG